jgi:glycosyltransferase involved in cell wall biosynthesis
MPELPEATPASPGGTGAPRVLFVIDSLSNNGAVQITVQLARRWQRQGAVLVAERAPTGRGLPVPDLVVEQLVRGGRRTRYQLGRVLARLARLSRRADVVIGGSEIGPALLVGFAAARSTRRPFIVSVHAELDRALTEWVPSKLQPLTRWVHRHADGAICIGESVIAPIEANGLPRERIRVVRNGIDNEAVRAAAAEAVGVLPGDGPIVVATGRLAPQKAHDLLIRAHARVVGTRPHRIALLNDGPDLAELEALAAELGVGDSVLFVGAVPKPLPYVAQADLFCLPSRHEGLPLALLEAVSLGVPVIAADCSEGVRDALAGGAVGELVPVDDVEALAAALDRHLADPSELRRRASRGPEHARGFDTDVMADGWAAAVADLTARARRGRRR